MSSSSWLPNKKACCASEVIAFQVVVEADVRAVVAPPFLRQADDHGVHHLALLHGALRRAAERIHLSPAAVHKHVRLLEGELGVPLFERSGRGLKATQAMEMLIPHLKELLSEHDLFLPALLWFILEPETAIALDTLNHK
jgi:biotin operon repressor